jgi:hypothetical protein
VSKSKAKGTSAEVAIRDYLRENGYPYCERLPTEGARDRGDLTGIDPSVVVEIKNCKTMDLAGWLKEVEVEKANAKARIGAIWHKRRGKGSPADWYVTMSGEDFLRLLKTWTHG